MAATTLFPLQSAYYGRLSKFALSVAWAYNTDAGQALQHDINKITPLPLDINHQKLLFELSCVPVKAIASSLHRNGVTDFIDKDSRMMWDFLLEEEAYLNDVPENDMKPDVRFFSIRKIYDEMATSGDTLQVQVGVAHRLLEEIADEWHERDCAALPPVALPLH